MGRAVEQRPLLDLIDSGFPGRFVYPREGGFLHTSTIDVVAGTKVAREANLYINYVLDPLFQLALLYFPYGPVNKSLEEVLTDYPALSEKYQPAISKELSVPDWNTVFADYAGLVDQWNRVVVSR